MIYYILNVLFCPQLQDPNPQNLKVNTKTLNTINNQTPGDKMKMGHKPVLYIFDPITSHNFSISAIHFIM